MAAGGVAADGVYLACEVRWCGMWRCGDVVMCGAERFHKVAGLEREGGSEGEPGPRGVATCGGAENSLPQCAVGLAGGDTMLLQSRKRVVLFFSQFRCLIAVNRLGCSVVSLFSQNRQFFDLMNLRARSTIHVGDLSDKPVQFSSQYTQSDKPRESKIIL